jgi:multicomponent Na+:H+ antiporter subunit A
LLRAAVAITAGVLAASICAALLAAPADYRLARFYAEAAPSIAKGQNLVNVILVDFRGLDTFVETLVLLLAALGVAGLLFGREIPAKRSGGASFVRERSATEATES